MVIVVKTQIEKMYAHPNTPYNYKISSNISLLFYKCHCLDLRFQTTPFRGWCRRSQILLTWNSTTRKHCNPNYIICTLNFWEIWYGWVTKQCDLSWPLSVSLAKECFPRLTHTSYWPGCQSLESSSSAACLSPKNWHLRPLPTTKAKCTDAQHGLPSLPARLGFL